MVTEYVVGGLLLLLMDVVLEMMKAVRVSNDHAL